MGDTEVTVLASRLEGPFERLAGTISPGETFERTFETAGEHRYFCIPHERDGMTGVVVVSE